MPSSLLSPAPASPAPAWPVHDSAPTGPHAAPTRGPSRRAVAQGAAWTVPTITLAAAAPAYAASECPSCFHPGSFLVTPGTALATAASPTSNTYSLVFDTTLNVDATGCPLSLFQPLYTYLGTSATLTMSNGTSYTSTLGLGTGAGSLGQISEYAFAGTFSNVTLSPFTATGGYPSGGIYPQTLCITFDFILVRVVGLARVTCPARLCWDLTRTRLAVGVSTGVLKTVSFAFTSNAAARA